MDQFLFMQTGLIDQIIAGMKLEDATAKKTPAEYGVLPKDLDGGSLRSVFEKGNKSVVSRTIEGFIYHYPCYFAPPLSVIRLGDYKLMEHLLTGEQKLFNVARDYREQHNLIEKYILLVLPFPILQKLK